MENDVNLLSKHGLMDYSLYLMMIIKPFKNVEFELPKTLMGPEEGKKLNFNIVNSYKKLHISEIDTSRARATHLVGRREDHIIMVMKERTRNTQTLYHICEPYDVSSIRIHQEEFNGAKNKSEGLAKRLSSANVSDLNQLTTDPLRGPTFQTRDQESVASDANIIESERKPTAVFDASQMGVAGQSMAQMVRENSVVNFLKTTQTFEFVQSKHSENRDALKDGAGSDVQVPQREQSFHATSDNLVARLNMFYQEKEEKDDGLVED